MKTSDITDPEARAWVHGFMSSHDIERGGDGRNADHEIEWHLEDLMHEICPYPTPELASEHQEDE